jgi:RES domain-containing protein
MGCGCLMLLWRLSGLRHASSFDGGYGLLFDGRWNTVGHAVTYCAISPSLCVLEKLVHVEDSRAVAGTRDDHLTTPLMTPASMQLAWTNFQTIGDGRNH